MRISRGRLCDARGHTDDRLDLGVLRGVLLEGSGWSEIAPEIWPIAAFMLVAGAIALNCYRETLD